MAPSSGHRHNQLALTYSGLSLCALARAASSETEKEHYLAVARRNLEQLHPWLECAEINIGMFQSDPFVQVRF